MKPRIKEILDDIPLKPGVYLMKDVNDDIIYVGKAKRLKNRVKSYFLDGKNITIKTRALVEHVENIDWIVTNSEHEAFALESNLIKQFMPRYNIMLKDDKHYPYIRVDVKDDYPTVDVVRKVKNDGAKYFGPYFDSTAMRTLLDIIQENYKIRTCKTNITKIKGKLRPCLNYDIGKCIGACRVEVSKVEYRKLIHEIIDLLNGHTKKIEEQLKLKMNEAAENMHYEKAAEYRDRVKSIGIVMGQGQRVISTTIETFDLFAIYHDDINAIAYVLISRAGKVIGSESFVMDMPEGGEASEIMTYFVQNYYMKDNIIPKNIYLSNDLVDLDDTKAYLSKLRQDSVNIIIPQKGKKKLLINMGIENAKLELKRKKLMLQRKWEKTGGAVQSLAKEIGMTLPPKRIEGFDISNIQGVDTVASMVVFVDGVSARKEYRRFKIKTVIGPDDFKSMAEVISRRFKRARKEIDEGKIGGFANLPDLVLIDGGKGQLAAAKKIIDELGFNTIFMIGLAKREEEVFLPGKTDPIIISKKAPALHLIQRIRDEAHRFAITYHRTLRKKRTYKSVLDDIEGIGAKRKHALLMAFPTISAIKNADVDMLSEIEGISRKTALTVYNFFNSSKHDGD